MIFANAHPFVAVAALVMGFSWSVALARIALEDMLCSEIPGLVHGQPVPFLLPDHPLCRFCYIDDFGVFGLDVYDPVTRKFHSFNVPTALTRPSCRRMI